MVYQTPSKSPDLLLHQKLLTCKCQNWIISRKLFHNHDYKVKFIFYFSNFEYLIHIHSGLIPTLILEGYSICKLSQKTKVFSKKDNLIAGSSPIFSLCGLIKQKIFIADVRGSLIGNRQWGVFDYQRNWI